VGRSHSGGFRQRLIGSRFGFAQRKKKEAKKKERGGLWKLPQMWKSIKVAFGDILLDDSHSCLKKPPRKTLRLLSQLPQGPTAGLT
jgi:hypothetical protein